MSETGITAGLHPGSGEDRVDLHLDPAAVAEAQAGMYAVVNNLSGTGHVLREDRSFKVAGKTGSAQASLLTIPATRNPEPDEELINYGSKDNPQWRLLVHPGTHENPNRDAPWYRFSGSEQKDKSHAWYMGFVPADHPRFAIAVLVEYGGSGVARLPGRSSTRCLMRWCRTATFPPDDRAA